MRHDRWVHMLSALLLLASGNLYGATEGGGDQLWGVVFKIKAAAR